MLCYRSSTSLPVYHRTSNPTALNFSRLGKAAVLTVAPSPSLSLPLRPTGRARASRGSEPAWQPRASAWRVARLLLRVWRCSGSLPRRARQVDGVRRCVPAPASPSGRTQHGCEYVSASSKSERTRGHVEAQSESLVSGCRRLYAAVHSWPRGADGDERRRQVLFDAASGDMYATFSHRLVVAGGNSAACRSHGMQTGDKSAAGRMP